MESEFEKTDDGRTFSLLLDVLEGDRKSTSDNVFAGLAEGWI